MALLARPVFHSGFLLSERCMDFICWEPLLSLGIASPCSYFVFLVLNTTRKIHVKHLFIYLSRDIFCKVSFQIFVQLKFSFNTIWEDNWRVGLTMYHWASGFLGTGWFQIEGRLPVSAS